VGYLVNAGVFLIQTFFEFFIGLFLVRTLLIAVNASFNDPICQFVYRLTNPAITPLRRYIPRWRKIEIASLLVALLLALIELALLTVLFGTPFSLPGWLLGAVVAVLNIAVWIMFWAILIRCVLSFFISDRYNSNAQLLTQFTEPVVRPFRRLLPALGGLDFSCWFASLALILVRLLILAPLNDLVARLN
jgi:YggT family protein